MNGTVRLTIARYEVMRANVLLELKESTERKEALCNQLRETKTRRFFGLIKSNALKDLNRRRRHRWQTLGEALSDAYPDQFGVRDQWVLKYEHYIRDAFKTMKSLVKCTKDDYITIDSEVAYYAAYFE